jgi:hypothetical protein
MTQDKIKLLTESITDTFIIQRKNDVMDVLDGDIIKYRYLKKLFGDYRTKDELFVGVNKENELLNDKHATAIYEKMIDLMDVFEKNYTEDEVTHLVSEISFRLSYLERDNFDETEEMSESGVVGIVKRNDNKDYMLNPVIRCMAIELDTDFIKSLMNMYQNYLTRFNVRR